MDKSYKLAMKVNKNFDGEKDFIKVEHSEELNITDEITVEAWVNSKDSKADALQTIISKWSPLTSFDTFDAYEAGNTSGLDSKGFLGAVFDGRYVYFVPQANATANPDGQSRHGIVLRYDTHGTFKDSQSWEAYDAGNTSGLATRGYYGAVFDGRYVYFVPRNDGSDYHTRALRYDTHGKFAEKKSWSAYDVGLPISYQSAGFDGRYIYFAPGTSKEKYSSLVLRYDTQSAFNEKASWVTFDANNTSGLKTKDFDGVVFDGQYMYFVPLSYSAVLRYDTKKDFKDKSSWSAFDAKLLGMKRCVGSVFDGRYIYFVQYANTVAVRYDIKGEFVDRRSWTAYDTDNTSGLAVNGYDGAVFDGKYIYFVPFNDLSGKEPKGHGNALRYDAAREFTDRKSWTAYDAGNTDGLNTKGYNGAAFDGRYIYFAPWNRRDNKDRGISQYNIIGHGSALRYDTLGENGSFSLMYCDCGHNGGLCAAVPGPRFLVNTDKGVRSIAANKALEQGEYYIVGVYNGRKIQLFIDGILVNEQSATGKIIKSKADIAIGRILDGLGYFNGYIGNVRISDCARSADWIKQESESTQ